MAPRRRSTRRGASGPGRGFGRTAPKARGAAALKRAGYKSWLEVPEDIRKDLNLKTRRAAAAVMNGLAEKGPRYSGQFINEWKAISLTGTGTSEGAGYPYKTADIPQLKITASSLNKVTVFSIFNTSEYADEAMDLVPGKWRKPPEDPLGGIEFGVLYGRRGNSPSFRWDVTPGEKGSGISTAEQDWYENYVRGGGLSADVKKSFEFQQGR